MGMWGMPLMPKALLLIALLLPPAAIPIRCYTDLEATQGASMECGMATGCVKIYRKALEFDPYDGKFIPPEKRGTDIDYFRGCFLISTPDICFDAKDGYSYCWCSTKDLCNSCRTLSTPPLLILLLASLPTLLLRLWPTFPYAFKRRPSPPWSTTNPKDSSSVHRRSLSSFQLNLKPLSYVLDVLVVRWWWRTCVSQALLTWETTKFTISQRHPQPMQIFSFELGNLWALLKSQKHVKRVFDILKGWMMPWYYQQWTSLEV